MLQKYEKSSLETRILAVIFCFFAEGPFLRAGPSAEEMLQR